MDKQTGDDWDDGWYQFNAGPPYEWAAHRDMEPYDLVTLGWDGFCSTPDARFTDRHLSVNAINAHGASGSHGQAPWLRFEDLSNGPSLYAGATVAEFAAFVYANGGTVYVPWPSEPWLREQVTDAYAVAVEGSQPDVGSVLRDTL
jgi:hypothetical protein